MEKCVLTKRLAIFAHYDKDNVIDDYVLYYLKCLKEVSEKIIFSSDCILNDSEKAKLEGLCDYVIGEKHNEYDFGSWKRGFEFANTKENIDFDELIFANDSCYGPFFPLGQIFDEMENRKCDFWGITENKYGIKKPQRHIQSYFMVFKKEVFQSSEFINFMHSIRQMQNKNNVIENYEIGLSQILFKNGFIGESYVEKYRSVGNSTIYKWRELIAENLSQFLKCSLLKLQNTTKTTVQGWTKTIDTSAYDIKLIENNLKRFNIRPVEEKSPLAVKRMFFNSILFIPKILREPIVCLVQKLLPFIFD